MNRLINWFVQNPVAANLLMMILIVSGLLALPNTHLEEFPNVAVDAVQIKVPYLGAAPEEVESAVCVRIEEAIEGTEGIDSIISTAAEGYCSVLVELVSGVDNTKVTNNIKSKVDAIDSFPGETERPITTEVTIVATIMDIIISGDTDERTLKSVGQQVRNDLAALPGISQVELLFARPYEISVNVSENTLRRHRLTLQGIGRIIAQGSVDVPGGALDSASGEILLRTRGQAYRGEEFESIEVLSRTDGTSLTLGQIASVVDGFEDSDLQARLNGEPAVIVRVSRVGEEDIMKMARRAREYLDQAHTRFPAGIKFSIWSDESEDMVDRLDALSSNASTGLLLVLLVLTLFLRFRLALWVAAGIPVALLGAVALFPLAGISISTMSIMGFILVLGILVDDAIVVGERVYAHEKAGKHPEVAAVEGTAEVSKPVIFGVLTSMATFITLVNIPGSMGSLFQSVGLTVIFALFFSIIESQLILPVHLAHRKVARKSKAHSRLGHLLSIQERLSEALETFAERCYQPAVAWVIRWRYATLALGLVMLAITAALFISGRMVFQFFPAVEGTRLFASLTLPEGTPVTETAKAVASIETAAEQLQLEIDAQLDISSGSAVSQIFSSIGSTIPKTGEFSTRAKSNLAEVGVKLEIPPEYGEISTGVYANRWRELTGGIPDAVELTFTAQHYALGAAIEFELYGSDIDQLRSAASELGNVLRGYDGVHDISDSFRAGKQEVQLSLLPGARNLGITLDDLGQQVRQAFYGYEAQRIQRGQDDIRVMVRYPEEERRSLGDLERMRIRTADGTEVPFSAAARATMSRGSTTIKRVDGQRAVSVRGDVDRGVIAPEVVINSVRATELPLILARHPGVNYQMAGESEEFAESLGGLISMAMLAMLVIYALLAIPLGSYLQPLVVMSVIPFGAMGAIFGHLILGMDLVFFSLFGIVALSGVVVNSSLVLVDHINRQRKIEPDLYKVVSLAGSVRFRPIVLTGATTFVGLLPLIMGDTVSLKSFVPMATSLAFGVLFGTLISLFLVPCLYLILEDLLKIVRGRSI